MPLEFKTRRQQWDATRRKGVLTEVICLFCWMRHPFLFDREFMAWVQDERLWPTERDFRALLEWSDVDFQPVVLDLAEGSPLAFEDEI